MNSATRERKAIESYPNAPTVLDFDLLYKQYSPKVYCKCLGLLKEESLAKDAMQEIFIRVFQKFSQFKQKSKFSTWLYAITYNYCMDCLKKKQTQKVKLSFDLDEALEIAEEARNPYLLDIKIAESRAVLKQLPKADRKILQMKFEDELSIKELAKMMSKSEGAIKMKINRAKAKAKRLRQQLGSSVN